MLFTPYHLSLEAQLEARVLMMSTNNRFCRLRNGGTDSIVPVQDYLGLYYIDSWNRDRHARPKAWFCCLLRISVTLRYDGRCSPTCTPQSKRGSTDRCEATK